MRAAVATASSFGATAFLAVMSNVAMAASSATTYTRLTGSPIVAQAPEGWVCSEGSAWAGNESTSVLSCLPREGGVPVSLRKMIGNDKPDSLQGYLQRLRSAYVKARHGEFYNAPSNIEIAGRSAVEVIRVGDATVDTTRPSAGGVVKMVSDLIVLEDKGAFYQCELSTTVQQYTDDLRHIHQAFCDALKFDAN
jgi:hypothetical protein